MAQAQTTGQLVAGMASLAIVAGSLLALLRSSAARPAPFGFAFDPAPGHPHWDLVAWERDRVQSLAKGMAGGAVTFLTSLFTAVLKGEVADTVPSVWIVGAALGVVGSLLMAHELHRRSGEWARPYYAAAP